MINKGLFSSKKDDWETPQHVFNLLNLEFGFTLDPCVNEFNRKCEKFYTKQQNGLLQSWKGETVFCNPPYGKEIGKWMQKCYMESLNGTTVVCLIPARTDTKWFHDWVYGKAEIRFVKGRIHFSGSKDNAPFPSLIVVYKENSDD